MGYASVMMLDSALKSRKGRLSVEVPVFICLHNMWRHRVKSCLTFALQVWIVNVKKKMLYQLLITAATRKEINISNVLNLQREKILKRRKQKFNQIMKLRLKKSIFVAKSLQSSCVNIWWSVSWPRELRHQQKWQLYLAYARKWFSRFSSRPLWHATLLLDSCCQLSWVPPLWDDSKLNPPQSGSCNFRLLISPRVTITVNPFQSHNLTMTLWNFCPFCLT